MTGVPEGREKDFGRVRSTKGARKEEGERVPLLFSLARGLAPKFPSLSFRTLATQARDNPVMSNTAALLRTVKSS